MEGRRYLEQAVSLRVRFHEVDAMGCVWHGHYATYFEEGRRAFGRRFGIDYPVFFRQGVQAPLVSMRVSYKAQGHMEDQIDVTARLWEPVGAKLEFSYEVRRQEDGRLLAEGETVQVFIDGNGELLLTMPGFMKDILKTWDGGWEGP